MTNRYNCIILYSNYLLEIRALLFNSKRNIKTSYKYIRLHSGTNLYFDAKENVKI